LGRLEGRIRSMLGDHTEDDLDDAIQREATRLFEGLTAGDYFQDRDPEFQAAWREYQQLWAARPRGDPRLCDFSALVSDTACATARRRVVAMMSRVLVADPQLNFTAVLLADNP
jgi:hypothetical protein